MPSSNAVAKFTFKNFKGALPPSDVDVGIATVLKKQQGDATFAVAFTDASLKDPKSGQGIIVSAEKPLGEGVKASLAYDVGKHTGTGMVTVNRSFASGSDLQLRAVYKQAGDVLILEETWKMDANNKLAASYNFSNEEALFAYSYSKHDWSATGRYNFAKDTTVLEVNKKQGKATLGASYALADGKTILSWSQKPFRAAIAANIGAGGLKVQDGSLLVTHEFDI